MAPEGVPPSDGVRCGRPGLPAADSQASLTRCRATPASRRRVREAHSLHGRRFGIAAACARSSSTSARPSMRSGVQWYGPRSCHRTQSRRAYTVDDRGVRTACTARSGRAAAASELAASQGYGAARPAASAADPARPTSVGTRQGRRATTDGARGTARGGQPRPSSRRCDTRGRHRARHPRL